MFLQALQAHCILSGILAALLALWPVGALVARTSPEDGTKVEERHQGGNAGNLESGDEDDEEEGEHVDKEEDEEEDAEEKRRPLLTFFDDKVSIGVLLELAAEYTDVKDEADKASGEQWELYVNTIEIELEIEPTDWLAFNAVGGIDGIAKSGDRAKPSLSEAFATLRHPQFPVYVVVGQRPLPFGVFEDHLISGTLTEELYEVSAVGGTVGIAPGWYGLDLSLSVYGGQDVIENLESFGAHEFAEGRRKEEGIDSYVLNLTAKPVKNALALSVFCDSEPGDGRRNLSMGAALTARFWKLVADAEYMAAVQRELGEDGEENLESAWVFALAHRLTKSWELAARFELFDDDRIGQQDETVSHRYLAGFNYLVTEYAMLSIEFRHTNFERESGSSAADAQNELQLRLALRF